MERIIDYLDAVEKFRLNCQKENLSGKVFKNNYEYRRFYTEAYNRWFNFLKLCDRALESKFIYDYERKNLIKLKNFAEVRLPLIKKLTRISMVSN